MGGEERSDGVEIFVAKKWVDKTGCSGHVLRKEDNDWVKKCMKYEVEGARPRGRPKKTRREIVEKDCQVRKLKREDAMAHNRWRKKIRDE